MITIIVGPQGSGKSKEVEKITGKLKPDQVTFFRMNDMDHLLNPKTKLIIIDEITSADDLFIFIKTKLRRNFDYIFISSVLTNARATEMASWANIELGLGSNIVACAIMRIEPKINIWTKILIVDGQQVLVYKEYCAEDVDDPYKLKAMCQTSAITFAITLSFTNEHDLDLQFKKYDSKRALYLLNSAKSCSTSTKETED